MNRRGLITEILALGAAPALVQASSLMKIPESRIWAPDGFVYAYHYGVDGDPFMSEDSAFLIPNDGTRALRKDEWTIQQTQKVRRAVAQMNNPFSVEARRLQLAANAAKIKDMNHQLKMARGLLCNGVLS
jgi:hypothetical protein